MIVIFNFMLLCHFSLNIKQKEPASYLGLMKLTLFTVFYMFDVSTSSISSFLMLYL